jgi:hypothetical protein
MEGPGVEKEMLRVVDGGRQQKLVKTFDPSVCVKQETEGRRRCRRS